MAMAFSHSHDMECCSEAEKTSEQDMPCCDEETSDKDSCDNGLCGCLMATSISAIHINFIKEIKFLDFDIEHVFPFPTSNTQTPFFPVWSPPDIA